MLPPSQLSGTRPLSYHVVNLLPHAGAGGMVFFILESVDYIAGRSEPVAGFFFLAAWLVFLRSFEGQIRAGVAFRRRLKLFVPVVVGGVPGALYILRGLTTGGAGTSAGASPLSYALTQGKATLNWF